MKKCSRVFAALLAAIMVFLSLVVLTSAEPSVNYKGDVNGDGEIKAHDALLALQQAVHKIELDEDAYARADVDGDGKVTAKDALKILQWSFGPPIREWPQN